MEAGIDVQLSPITGDLPPLFCRAQLHGLPPLKGAGDGIVKQCICEAPSLLMEA